MEFIRYSDSRVSLFGRNISVFSFDREFARKVPELLHELVREIAVSGQKAGKSLLFSL